MFKLVDTFCHVPHILLTAKTTKTNPAVGGSDMIITATAFAGVGTLVTALLHVEMRQEHASKLAVRVMDVLMGAAIAAPVCVMLALG